MEYKGDPMIPKRRQLAKKTVNLERKSLKSISNGCTRIYGCGYQMGCIKAFLG